MGVYCLCPCLLLAEIVLLFPLLHLLVPHLYLPLQPLIHTSQFLSQFVLVSFYHCHLFSQFLDRSLSPLTVSSAVSSAVLADRMAIHPHFDEGFLLEWGDLSGKRRVIVLAGVVALAGNLVFLVAET